MTSPPHSPDDPPDEDGLWENYKRGVTPLSLKQRVKTSPSRLKKPSQRRQSPPIPTLASGLPSAARTAPGELERNERRRLQRGDILIEERLDLHGLTQATAHHRLLTFLHGAQQRGVRFVIVITGKGRGEEVLEEPSGRGVLKRAVPLWLCEAEFRALVAAVSPASRHHGGEGALYLRLRRLRSRHGDD